MMQEGTTPTPPLKGRGLENEQTPPLQGRGKGWGLSKQALAPLQAHAVTMRREPTEPEKRLWRALSGSKLAGFKFRRQAVIGPYIADFLCPQKALVVEVDGDTHAEGVDAVRDAWLVAHGYIVVLSLIHI